MSSLGGRALRMSNYVYFKLKATFFYQRFRASLTGHRQQSTKVSAKGTDLIESRVFFSVT